MAQFQIIVRKKPKVFLKQLVACSPARLGDYDADSTQVRDTGVTELITDLCPDTTSVPEIKSRVVHGKALSSFVFLGYHVRS